jgi:uncharacterized membrane protein required for colicin V production
MSYTSTILSAAENWYVDVAIVAVLLLSVLCGVIFGLSKSTKGFLVSIVIVFASLLLASAFHPMAMEGPIGTGIEESLVTKADDWSEAYHLPVAISAEGEVLGLYQEDGSIVEFTSVTEGIKGKFAEWAAKQYVTEDGVAVDHSLASGLTSLIVSLLLIVIFNIALTIVLAIVRKIMKNLAENGGAGKVVDKVLGGAFSLLVGYVFICIVFGILAALENKMPTITAYVKGTPLGEFFYYHNPIADMWQSIFLNR